MSATALPKAAAASQDFMKCSRQDRIRNIPTTAMSQSGSKTTIQTNSMYSRSTASSVVSPLAETPQRNGSSNPAAADRNWCGLGQIDTLNLYQKSRQSITPFRLKAVEKRSDSEPAMCAAKSGLTNVLVRLQPKRGCGLWCSLCLGDRCPP